MTFLFPNYPCLHYFTFCLADHEQRALLSFTADSVDTLKSSTVAEDIVRVLNIIWNKLFPEIEDVEWDQLTSMLNKGKLLLIDLICTQFYFKIFTDNVSVDSPQTSELKETVDMTTSTDSTLNKKSLRGMEVEESVVDNANGMLT